MKAVRVAIDVSAVPYGRGVSRYTSNLVEALAARPDVELNLFGAVGKSYAEIGAWVRDLRGRPRSRIVAMPSSWLDRTWRWLGQPGLKWLAPGADVVHAWEWQLPPASDLPLVVTIHDLAHMLFPETAHPEVIRRFEALFIRLKRDPQAQIIAVSQSTKRDITRLTGIDPERITVVLEALPAEAKYVPSQQEVDTTLQKHGLAKPYLLFVGTSEPRKNLPRVIQAWQLEAQALGFELVLAGAKGWDNLPQVDGLRQLGYVSSAELACLYRGASALVFPSLYEGFGLPVLEAYYHQCPVIASRVSSFPEVAGEAATLVDPYEPREIAAGIRQVLSMSPSQKIKLQQAMAQQLTKFSWERAAEETVQVYRKASRG